VPAVRARLSAELLDELRWALVERSRDPAADLRARVAAGLELGWLGDPRFERCSGPHGRYLLPPRVAIPGGVYPIGEDEPIWDAEREDWDRAHLPRHAVELEAFSIGQFPVTNAEWAGFMAAGGYEDERWWDTAAGRAWQRGEGTAEGMKASARAGLQRIRARPLLLEELHDRGQIDDANYERWQRRLAMTEEELEAHLRELYPGGRLTEPRLWREEAYNNPLQPVVGICWYEARAYCAWLAAQTGCAFRLPAEAEWEAAARGAQGRRYAWGDDFDPLKTNMMETHIKRPSPVGVFVGTDTPEAAADMTGNVEEWTSSSWGREIDEPEHPYPYLADDGREDATATAEVRRVMRGSSWFSDRALVRCAWRDKALPDVRAGNVGLRVAG
jgi:formylglycine-generating enzyme required for sulfatase activity